MYETTVNTTVNEVVDELIQINNFRVLIDRLAVSIEDLATHGVIKPDELRGLSPQETEEFDASTLPKEYAGFTKRPPLQQG